MFRICIANYMTHERTSYGHSLRRNGKYVFYFFLICYRLDFGRLYKNLIRITKSNPRPCKLCYINEHNANFVAFVFLSVVFISYEQRFFTRTKWLWWRGKTIKNFARIWSWGPWQILDCRISNISRQMYNKYPRIPKKCNVYRNIYIYI